jgi:hypothetical protein
MKILLRAGALALGLLMLCAPETASAQCAANTNITGRPCVNLKGNEWFDFRQGGQAVTAPIANLAASIRQRPLPVSRSRLVGASTSLSGAFTLLYTVRAPADYDAVQLVMVSPANDGTNAVKFSVAAPDVYGDGVNATVAGAAVTPTAVTWGTTSPRNHRNPGGGAATILQSGVTGSAQTLIEGNAYSDIIPLQSQARTDIVGAPPLLMIREYGTNPPALATASLATFITTAANPASGAIPEVFCGHVGGSDVTASASGITPPSAGSQGYCASVEVIFYLRGQRVNTIASGGDSLDQGYCLPAATNCSAGTVNGWSRQLAGQLTAAGNPTGYTSWNYQGQYASNFNERALTPLMLGDCAAGITHLFFKPYSINEGNVSVVADMKRADHVLDWAYRCNITPVLVYPWAGQGIGTTAGNQIVAYIDAAKARGVATFDARAIISADGSLTSNSIKTSCLTLNSSGVKVDDTHINATCQKSVADLANAQRATFNLP